MPEIPRRPNWIRVSILMSVYHRESPQHLAESLDSLVAQTLPADEIVIVRDGPLGAELDEVIAHYSGRLPIATLDLPVNRGLGPALRAGVERCRNDWIARMDSDDICVPNRLELQAAYLQRHPEADILGASIAEFDDHHALPHSVRSLPEEHEAIRAFARFRNPLNHMTVIFRRQAVLDAGNYQAMNGFEDYDLWVRMLMRGCRFRNLPQALVLARCGNGMQQRRGSFQYGMREVALFWSFRKRGFLTTGEFVRNVAIRVPLRILPAQLRSRIYRGFLRRPPKAIETADSSS